MNINWSEATIAAHLAWLSVKFAPLVKSLIVAGTLMCAGCGDLEKIIVVRSASGDSTLAPLPEPQKSSPNDSGGISDRLALADLVASTTAKKVGETLADPLAAITQTNTALTAAINDLRESIAKPAPQPAVNAGPSPNSAAQPANQTPRVTVYSPSWCSLCKQLEKDVAGFDGLEFRILHEDQFPTWLRSNDWPVLHWQRADGTYQLQSGWSGLRQFLAMYDATQAPTNQAMKAGTGAPRRAQTYQSPIYFRGYSRTVRWSWPGDLRIHLQSAPHRIPAYTVYSYSDGQCIQVHNAYHDVYGERAMRRSLKAIVRASEECREQSRKAGKQLAKAAEHDAKASYHQARADNPHVGWFGRMFGVTESGRAARHSAKASRYAAKAAGTRRVASVRYGATYSYSYSCPNCGG